MFSRINTIIQNIISLYRYVLIFSYTPNLGCTKTEMYHVIISIKVLTFCKIITESNCYYYLDGQPTLALRRHKKFRYIHKHPQSSLRNVGLMFTQKIQNRNVKMTICDYVLEQLSVAIRCCQIARFGTHHVICTETYITSPQMHTAFFKNK